MSDTKTPRKATKAEEDDADTKISSLVDALNSPAQSTSKKVNEFKRLSTGLRRAK